MFGKLVFRLRCQTRRLFRHYGWPLGAALALAVLATMGGSWGTALGQTAIAPTATPTATPPPLVLAAAPGPAPTPAPLPPVPIFVPGVQPAGPAVQSPVSTDGGQVNTGNPNVLLMFSSGSVDRPAVVDYIPVIPGTAPPPSCGFLRGETAFQLTVRDAATGVELYGFPAPLVITYRPTSAEMAAAGGNLSLVMLCYWNGNAWVALTGTPNANGTITYTLPYLLQNINLLAVLIRPEGAAPVGIELPNGRFFTATNGFGGACGTGFAVTDDGEIGFWTEFQRMGGVDRVGYPISGRFMHGGFVTQAFQKFALQWRPELVQTVPVNVFDDLHMQGADSWLDTFEQVPPAADTGADTNLPWDQVVARHVAILDPYPALRNAYLADPNWLESYGLPVSVKDYGPMVTARLQRATLQLWKVDMPWAAAGTVVVGNGGDLAKEAGLWPADAVTPRLP